MLEAYIIDELRRREAERSRIDGRPRVELPLPAPMYPDDRPNEAPDDEPETGVTIIEL